MTRILALDLGGTKLRAAIGEEPRLVELRDVGAWPAPESLAAFTARIGMLLGEEGPIERVGLAVPGLVEGSSCRWIPNLPWLDGIDVAGLFPDLSVTVVNDAQIALVAEAVYGAAAGLADALLVSIGTGIGSAILAGGRIVKGSHGGACSFGWACAGAGAPIDARNGGLERVAAGPAIDTLAVEILGRPDGRGLIDLARGGDARAQRALLGPAEALGIALVGATALLDPQAILVTGGIADALDALAPTILRTLRERLPPHLRAIEIRAGHFGARASLLGAAVAGSRGSEWGSVR